MPEAYTDPVVQANDDGTYTVTRMYGGRFYVTRGATEEEALANMETETTGG